MKKIMFNDCYGLTKAVLEGRKTMTRRSVPEKLIKAIEGGVPGFVVMESKYKVGEVVAVAQNYNDVRNGGYPVDSRYDAFRDADWGDGVNGVLKCSAGENNKMFVRANLMPHQIRITNIRIERLQDITDEDCLLEGIERVYYGDEEWFKAYDTKDGCKCAPTPKEAFAALIDKVSGNGTWESNPWVFVYEFELVK